MFYGARSSRQPITVTVVTEAEYKSQFEPTKYIPYLALTGEASYDLYFVRVLEKIDRVITAPHCMLWYIQHVY